MVKKEATEKPEILLVGYNGANNTGSEARLIAIIEDIYSVFGRDVRITVPTFNIKNLKRYIKEGPFLKIVSVPSVYIFSLKRLIKSHDFVILVEGSCYMDTWTTALLRAFLTSTKHARAMDKPVLAYAVDVGELSSSNLRILKKYASMTNLIITRSKTSAEALKSRGVTAPVRFTADSAFSYLPEKDDDDFLYNQWPESSGGTAVGFALVNYFLWPVVVRIIGKKENCYRWPYYFSKSKERSVKTEEYAKRFAEEMERIIEQYDCFVPLICMEQLDEPFADKIFGHLSADKRNRVKIFSSGRYNASQMTCLLRKLDLLVTSRYHGFVLAMQAGIPVIAIGHDLRLKVLFQETGLIEKTFIDYKSPDLFDRLRILLDRILKRQDKGKEPGFAAGVREMVLNSYKDLKNRSEQNRQILKDFAMEYGWI